MHSPYLGTPLGHTPLILSPSVNPVVKMQNDAGQNVDLYIPRKCSWTHRLITAKDHASVQINVGSVDPATGRYTGEFKTYAICGYIRSKSEGDMALTQLIAEAENTAARRH